MEFRALSWFSSTPAGIGLSLWIQNVVKLRLKDGFDILIIRPRLNNVLREELKVT